MEHLKRTCCSRVSERTIEETYQGNPSPKAKAMHSQGLPPTAEGLTAAPCPAYGIRRIFTGSQPEAAATEWAMAKRTDIQAPSGAAEA